MPPRYPRKRPLPASGRMERRTARRYERMEGRYRYQKGD